MILLRAVRNIAGWRVFLYFFRILGQGPAKKGRKAMSAHSKTRIMTDCAILVAMSVVLNFIKFAPWPNGGSITLGAMVPLVYLSLRHGCKWGVFSAFVYSVLQMLLDGVISPAGQSFGQYILVVLLDYVLAYTVLGLAGFFARFSSKENTGAVVGALAVTGLRYVCHILSGILIWGVYAPENMPVWLYSLTYNGSYMIPEMIITAVLCGLLVRFVPAKSKMAA